MLSWYGIRHAQVLRTLSLYSPVIKMPVRNPSYRSSIAAPSAPSLRTVNSQSKTCTVASIAQARFSSFQRFSNASVEYANTTHVPMPSTRTAAHRSCAVMRRGSLSSRKLSSLSAAQTDLHSHQTEREASEVGRVTAEQFAEKMHNLGMSVHDDIAVAVSGGSDSISLAILLSEWRRRLLGDDKSKWNKIYCVVVDHGIRDSASLEADMVEEWAIKYDLEPIKLRVHWPDGKLPNLSKLQTTAREQRYQQLEEFCQAKNVQHVFVSHHADDAVETLLLRLFRASGVIGLATMQEVSSASDYITLVRPLLSFRKQQLRQVCLDYDQEWIVDPSNEDLEFDRNRVRYAMEQFVVEADHPEGAYREDDEELAKSGGKPVATNGPILSSSATRKPIVTPAIVAETDPLAPSEQHRIHWAELEHLLHIMRAARESLASHSNEALSTSSVFIPSMSACILAPDQLSAWQEDIGGHNLCRIVSHVTNAAYMPRLASAKTQIRMLSEYLDGYRRGDPGITSTVCKRHLGRSKMTFLDSSMRVLAATRDIAQRESAKSVTVRFVKTDIPPHQIVHEPPQAIRTIVREWRMGSPAKSRVIEYPAVLDGEVAENEQQSKTQGRANKSQFQLHRMFWYGQVTFDDRFHIHLFVPVKGVYADAPPTDWIVRNCENGDKGRITRQARRLRRHNVFSLVDSRNVKVRFVPHEFWEMSPVIVADGNKDIVCLPQFPALELGYMLGRVRPVPDSLHPHFPRVLTHAEPVQTTWDWSSSSTEWLDGVKQPADRILP
jgi:tRNA(Ile)-lysidine synthetase-like protein